SSTSSPSPPSTTPSSPYPPPIPPRLINTRRQPLHNPQHLPLLRHLSPTSRSFTTSSTKLPPPLNTRRARSNCRSQHQVL
ncbi:hypothetical protein PQX77_015559, partial [Marasmius sp. AFHP31]